MPIRNELRPRREKGQGFKEEDVGANVGADVS